jgi:putative heme-binding domain-containing protein
MKLLRWVVGLACLASFTALIADLPSLVLPWIGWFLGTAAASAYLWPATRTGLFVLVVLALFVYTGAVVTRISGGEVPAAAAEGVSVEAGEAIYWGKGKCSTCHSLGDRGSAVRGPNHAEVCGKARDLRVAERQAAGASQIVTATDYLVESIAEPDSYIVEGFSAAMPKVYLPPISLSAEEVAAVVLYLQAQGCEPDPAAIELPPAILNAAAAQAEQVSPFSLVVVGDPAAGEALFRDPAGPAGCVQCHTVAGEGGEVGPELTDVAGTQTLAYIFESILNPSAAIAGGGYEPIQLQLSDGSVLSGVIKAEDDVTVSVVDKEGGLILVEKSDIQRERRYPDIPSLMPGNFGELLTVKQVADLIAFLQQSAGVLPLE